MIQFRRNSYANIILEYIALCGEFPYQSLQMLDKNKVVLQRTINSLKKEGYITITGSGPMKTIRMTTKAFPVVEAINPEFLKDYMLITENHHFRGGTYKKNNVGARQTWRRHRMAEILCVLYQLDVLLWQYTKPELSLLPSASPSIPETKNIFYSSKELKNADKSQRYKTDFTRIMGALFSEGGIYCVYNTNKGLMKWNSQGEGKAQVLVEDIVRQNSVKYHNSAFSAENAIIFGKEMEPALEILTSNGGKRDSNGFELLSFDNTYRNIYYVTLDANGKEQLKMMMQNQWHQRLRTAIFPDEYASFQLSNIDCDAYDGEKYILMFFDGNIGRLRRFYQASFDADKKFEILCFPWQVDMIKKYTKNKIPCRILELEDIANVFK